MLAILYSLPLLMISILCASLALDKPQVAVWRTNVNYPGVTVIKKTAEQGMYIATQYTSTSNATEWRIWGWAIVPPLIILAIGIACSFVRYGNYLTTLAAIAIAIGVTHRLDTWVAHHTQALPVRLRQHPRQHQQARPPEHVRHRAVGTLCAQHRDQHPPVADRRGLRGPPAHGRGRGAPPARKEPGWEDTQPPAAAAGAFPGIGTPGTIVPPAGGVPPQ